MNILSIKMLLAGAEVILQSLSEGAVEFKDTSIARDLPSFYFEATQGSLWKLNGNLHRTNGPALSYLDEQAGCMVFEYWLNGKYISRSENPSTRESAEQKFKEELIKQGYQ